MTPEQDKFCDNNCVWTDHHPNCKLGQPDRQELQGKGEHPAPCARFCEANAFQIEIRNLKAKLKNQHPEWYHTKNIHGCDVFYHKTEERSYMSGEITPLYTTPPQRKPLTSSVNDEMLAALEWITTYIENAPQQLTEAHQWAKISRGIIEAALGIKE